MALLYADGFDHWGTWGNMLATNWFDVSFGGRTSVANSGARTGNYSLSIGSTIGNGFGAGAFHMIGGTHLCLGMGIAFYLSGLPNNTNSMGWGFIAGDFSFGFKVGISVAGELLVYDTTGTLKGTSAVGIIKPTSYSYIEIRSIIDGITFLATVTIRLNGQTVLTVANISTGGNYAGIYLGKFGTNNATPQINFDDYVLWDNTGTDNNSFLGDRRCFTSFPSADTALAAWLPSSGGTGFNLISEVPPDDTSFITAQNAGDISEFSKSLITVATTSVAAVVIFGRGAKTDAGTCTFRMGIHSGSFVANSAAISPGTGFAYYTAIIERDPNGSIPWTKAAIDAATLRLTRDS